jgi:hypothetical protein
MPINFFKGSGDDVPDREDTTGLSKASFLLNTADSLLQDGGDLGGSGLGLRGVGTNLLRGTIEGTGSSRASLETRRKFCQRQHYGARARKTPSESHCRPSRSHRRPQWGISRDGSDAMDGVRWQQGRDGRTHRGDPASGRSSRNGAARLPQSGSEHYERGGFREVGKMNLLKGELGGGGRREGGGGEERRCEWMDGREGESFVGFGRNSAGLVCRACPTLSLAPTAP